MAKTEKRKRGSAPPQTVAPDAQAARAIHADPFWLRSGWLLAALAAALLHLPTLGYDFTYDDFGIVKNNLRIRELGNPRAYLWTSYWDAPGMNREYRPLTLLSYAVQHAFAGLRPWSYHAVNVALHALVCAAAWLLAMELFRRRGLALFAALAFAIHPVHIEAVAGVVGRAELASALGFLLALCAAARSIRAAPPERWRWAAATGLLAAFAIGWKENAVTLIPTIALAAAVADPRGNRVVFDRGSMRETAARAWPALACAGAAVLAYLLLRALVLGGLKGKPGEAILAYDNPIAALKGLPQKLTALKVLALYGWTLLFPFNLSPDYSPNTIKVVERLGDPTWLIGAAIVPAYLAALWAARRRPAALFGLLFFLVTFILTSNLLFPIGTIFAERLLYLPSLGACIAAGDAAACVFDRRAASPRWALGFKALVGALALFAAAYLAQTFRYLPAWRENDALCAYLIRRAPDSARANLYHAIKLIRDGKHAEAIPFLEKADRIVPDIPMTLAYLGHAHFKAGRLDEASLILERAVKLFPGDADAVKSLARLCAGRGEIDRAESLFKRALEIQPGKTDILYDYGWFLADLGAKRKDGAMIRRGIELLTRVIPESGDGADDEGLRALGIAYLDSGDPARGERYLRMAHALKPKSSLTLYNLARALLAQGRAGEAEGFAIRLAELEPNSKAAKQLLAEVHAARGK